MKFQKGDIVECIGKSSSNFLVIGKIYTIDAHKDNGDVIIEEALQQYPCHAYQESYFKHHEKKLPLGGKDMKKCDNRKCEYYDIGEDNHCEEWTNYDLCQYHGGGTIWPKLEPKTTKENNMKDNNIDSNVLAIFGDKVKGNELVVIDRHFTDNMLKEILMETYSKEIQTACKNAEAKRLKEEAKK